MDNAFAQRITLLRKELGISQKAAAKKLEVSQALLSHYENGIRGASVEFVLKASQLYNVSCDYLLGKSNDRNGIMIAVPSDEKTQTNGTKNTRSVSLANIYNQKLITDSISVLYSLLEELKCKTLTNEVSIYISIAIYYVFQMLYNSDDKQNCELFGIDNDSANYLCDAASKLVSLKIRDIIKDVKNEHMQKSNCDKTNIPLRNHITEENQALSHSLFNVLEAAEKKLRSVSKK